ncbi:MAG TPA: hypothetical protein VF610_00970 [Segetibacter sp.]|jgi:hypothetical protein
MSISKNIIDLLLILCKAIKQRRIISFDFESDRGYTALREIKPYMIYVNDREEIKVVGLPRELWKAPMLDRQPRHYLLDKIDLKQLVVMSKIFNDPGVRRDIVENTKVVRVICRFIYDDENEEEVRASWIKLEDL